MATIDVYNCPSSRSCIAHLAGSGQVVTSVFTPPTDTTARPWSVTCGPDIVRYYTGPLGGPHPPFLINLGIIGDLQAWNGLRTTQGTQAASGMTTPAADPTYEYWGTWADSSTSNWQSIMWSFRPKGGSTAANFERYYLNVLRQWVPALGNYVFTTMDTIGSGESSCSVAGLKLDSASILALAEALAGMLQVVNNVYVGQELQTSVDQIRQSLQSLAESLGEAGFQGSFDAAMDLLIDRLGSEGPFSDLSQRLQDIANSFGPDSQVGEMSIQLASVVAALGVGGVFGSLATGGTIAESVAKLNPILGALQSIGGVADAIVEYNQLGKLDSIIEKLNLIASEIDTLSAVHNQSVSSLRDRIAPAEYLSLAHRLDSHAAALNSNIQPISIRLGEIRDNLQATISGVSYDVVQAIAEFSGGSGGTGGSVDLSPVISALQSIAAAISSSGGVDMDRLAELGDSWFKVDPASQDSFNVADMIRSLVNTGFIIYR